MKIAVFQMSAAADPATNPDRIIAAMRDAKGQGADLLVAPELALTGYGRGDVLRDLAEPADGPMVARMVEVACGIGIGLIAGFPERDGETLYISALVTDGAGAVEVYRKAYLYGQYEKDLFQGNGPSCFVTDLFGLKVGLLICYDVEFPENVRRLALAGAEVVIVPTALPKGTAGHHIATRTIPVRAFENQVHLAYADHADGDGRFDYQGLSSVAAPDATVLAMAGETGDALLFAGIDPGVYGQSREENPYLDDLRNI